MRLSVVRLNVLLVPSCLLVAGAASAQVPAAAAARQPTQLRFQIAIMEGALERAVGEGIRGAVNQMPELFQGPGGMWVTPPRARGFKIDGYGVFFDVEVPGLPATSWSISVITRNNEIAFVNELNQMRAVLAQAALEPSKRVELTKSLDKLEARVSGAALSEPGVPPAAAGATVVSEGTRPASVRTPAPSITAMHNPNEIYTEEVQKALTNVMLAQAKEMQVAADEWFTVAASESRAGFGEPETLTLYLSIRGRDLAALRALQITREEAAKRIVIKNY